MMVFEVLLVLFIIFTMMGISGRYAGSEAANKVNLAEDLKMMIDTLVGVPGDAVVKYPANVSKYSFVLNAISITVSVTGEGEQNHVTTRFSLPEGYDAFGTLEGTESLCLEKSKRNILLRECEMPKPAEEKQAKPKIEGPSFFGIPVTGNGIVFIIDRSDSMKKPSEWVLSEMQANVKQNGTRKIDVARWQFKAVLEQLPDGKKFNLILFHGEASNKDVFSASMKELNTETRKQASAYVDTFYPWDGTNLYDPLKKALSFEGVDTIFLLTDGLPNFPVGYTEPDELIKKISELNKNNVKINTIGFFELDPKDSPRAKEEKEKGKKMLKGLADGSGGEFIMQGETS